MKQKLYFKSIDDTICSSLQSHLEDAKYDVLTKVTLVEAIPDNDTSEFIWCTHYWECVERQDCKKALCSHYSSKSGRGKCSNRGNLYLHGDEVGFIIE